MLSKEAARKSVFANLVDLYKSDPVFRGMTDFAIIGAVAMMFLDPPHKVQWPWSGSGHGSGQVSSAGLDPGGVSGGSGSAAVAPSGPIAAGPVVAIPYPASLKNPRLGVGFLFDIDAKAFESSSDADRPRLQAALKGVVLRDPDLIIEELRAADGDDPNVALMRGAAFVMRNTEASNRTGEALWRQAVNGGSVQAKALLGRLLVSGREGVKQDATQGGRLIEEGMAAGDPQAMRFLGIGYQAGDLGVLDPFKAAQTLKQAADAGDAMAMAVYSRMLAEGIGVSAPDGKQAEHYLRKAANAGLTFAQKTLGDWLISQYEQGLTPDPQEAVDWLTKAYEKGHDIEALTQLAYIYGAAAKKPPWKDVERAMDYVRLCSGFSSSTCQFNAGVGWRDGHFGRRDAALARAHFAISDSLGYRRAAAEVQRLDGALSPAEKEKAEAYEKELRAALKAIPTLIPLQYAAVASPPAPKAVSSYIQAAADSSSSNTGQQSWTEVADSPDFKLCADSKADTKARGEACGRIIDAGKGSPKELSWAYFGRGWMQHNLKKNGKAITDYSQAVKLNPSHIAARNNRGNLYTSANKLDLALDDFDAILKFQPDHKYALSGRAEVLRKKGQLQDALNDVKKALNVDPNFKGAQKVQTDILADMKKGAGVERGTTDGKPTLGPDDPPSASSKEVVALRERAGKHLSNKDYDSAIADYTDIIRRGSAIWSDYNGRGLAYHNKNQLDLALADYNRAIGRSGHNEFVHYNRSTIYKAQGQTDKALADLDAAIDQHGSTDPNHYLARADTHLEMSAFEGADVLLARADIERAIKDYDKVVDLLAKDKSASKDAKAFAFYVRGQAKERLVTNDQKRCENPLTQRAGEGPDCRNPMAYMIPLLDFEAAIATKPDFAPAHFKIGWIAGELGNTQKAIESYTKAIKADPTYSMAYSNRCVVYTIIKQMELALADCNDAIRHDTNNHHAWANRGVIFATKRGRKNRNRAISDLRQALQIKPDYAFALQALRRMGVKP